MFDPNSPLNMIYLDDAFREIWKRKHTSISCSNAFVSFMFYAFTKVPFEIMCDVLFKPTEHLTLNHFMRVIRQGLFTFPQLSMYDYLLDASGLKALRVMEKYWNQNT